MHALSVPAASLLNDPLLLACLIRFLDYFPHADLARKLIQNQVITKTYVHFITLLKILLIALTIQKTIV